MSCSLFSNFYATIDRFRKNATRIKIIEHGFNNYIILKRFDYVRYILLHRLMTLSFPLNEIKTQTSTHHFRNNLFTVMTFDVMKIGVVCV